MRNIYETKHLATIVQKYKEEHMPLMLTAREDPGLLTDKYLVQTDLNLINESFLVSGFELHV